MRSPRLVVTCIILIFNIYSCTADGGDAARTVVDLIQQLGATHFMSYLNESGLLSNLTSQGPYTVFVPTDEAFKHIPDDMKSNFDDKEYVRSILKYHIAPGIYFRQEFQDEEELRSLKKNLKIRMNIYQGGKVLTASGCPISSADNNAGNGVVHLLDRVMYMDPELGSVASLLSWPIFRYMYYGMIDGNLTHVLNGNEPITVFVPNDLAFQQLPPDVFKKMYQNATAIRRMVRNHIVRGTLFTAGMYDGEPLTTLDGQTLHVKVNNGNVTVNDALMVIPDFTCTNGVAHVTSAVFMPPGLLESHTLNPYRTN